MVRGKGLYRLLGMMAVILVLAGIGEAGVVFVPAHLSADEPGGTVSWADWSEDDPQTLSCDTAKTYICIFDDATLGADEVGYGYTSGADLVMTESGNVPGATGTPLYRQLTSGSSQKFTFTVNLQNMLSGQASWFVLLKFTDYASAGNNGMLLAWNGAGNVAGTMHLRFDAGGVLSVNAPGLAGTVTAGGINATDDEVYVAVWRKSGGDVRAGFQVGSKITSWAGLNANNRVSAAGAAFTNPAASNPAIVGQRAGWEYVTVKLHYIILSREPEVFVSD